MEDKYKATATLEDGEDLEMVGTIMECSKWGTEVIWEHDGPVQLKIEKIGEVKE